MYSDGKVQLCVGSCSSIVSWVAGLSFAHDVMPIVSYIGVCAGAFVALHGVYVIVRGWIKQWLS